MYNYSRKINITDSCYSKDNYAVDIYNINSLKNPTNNKILSGNQNPKTLINPIIIPPSHDIQYWKINDLISHSNTNNQIQDELYLNGYLTSNDVENFENISNILSNNEQLKIPRENTSNSSNISSYYDNNSQLDNSINNNNENTRNNPNQQSVNYNNNDNTRNNPNQQSVNYNNNENTRNNPNQQSVNYKNNENTRNNPNQQSVNYNNNENTRNNPNQQSVNYNNTRSNPKQLSLNYNNDNNTRRNPNQQSVIYNNNVKNVGYTGYEENNKYRNENSVKSEYVNYNNDINLGNNFNYTDVKKNENYLDDKGADLYSSNLKEYDRNIKTVNIGPSVYKYNEIIEPINSNIGITLTQNIPYISEINNDGNTYINEVNFKTPDIQKDGEIIGPEFHNVYDPRFNGYGTSYRAYIEPVTGQPRFMYDDINALKMPNYIVRSNIDHIKSANSYGTLEESNKNGIQNFLDLRKKVEKEWVDNSITFRNDMMERLMRKRNNELVQSRRMPVVKSAYTSRG